MHQKITSAVFDALPLHGQGRSSPTYNAILNLKVGEALIIDKKEWKPNYPPTRLVNKIERKFGTQYVRGALPDRTGWAVKRIK